MYRIAKRILDLSVSSAGLLLLAPFVPLVAILIKLDSRGPVIFKQDRLGKNGKMFTIFKLRTMAEGAPEISNPDGSKYVGEQDSRLTRLGRFLRDSSIDELPQLWNVLKGEMSLVGPRPDQPGRDLHLSIFQTKRMMKPGLTSPAAILGRNSLPWRRRVELDVEYVTNASFALDLDILLKTVSVVLKRHGIYSNSTVSLSPRSTTRSHEFECQTETRVRPSVRTRPIV